jgi:hypothetical protein
MEIILMVLLFERRRGGSRVEGDYLVCAPVGPIWLIC